MMHCLDFRKISKNNPKKCYRILYNRKEQKFGKTCEGVLQNYS